MAWIHNGRKYWYHKGKRYSCKIRRTKRLSKATQQRYLNDIKDRYREKFGSHEAKLRYLGIK